MPTIQRLLAPLLCLSIANLAIAGEKQANYAVTYSGGSIASIKSGQGLRMFLDPDQVRLIGKRQKDEPLLIRAANITEISYGQEVHRRIGTAIGLGVISLGIGALMAFSKSKKHYIGIVWDSGDGKKGGLVLQADKNEYRGIIAALEGLTGKTAVNTDLGRPNS